MGGVHLCSWTAGGSATKHTCTTCLGLQRALLGPKPGWQIKLFRNLHSSHHSEPYTCKLAMTGQGVPCCGTSVIFWSSGGRRSGGRVLSCGINRDAQSSGCYLAAHGVREGLSPSCSHPFLCHSWRCSVTSGTSWRWRCHLREFSCPFHWVNVWFSSQVLVNSLVLTTVCSPSQILSTSKE